MKKVSEVKKELEALGCNEKVATELLVACGILENDVKEKFEIGDLWEYSGQTFMGLFKITSMSNEYNLGIFNGTEMGNACHRDRLELMNDSRFKKLVWRG